VGSLLHENGCGVYVLNPRLDGLDVPVTAVGGERFNVTPLPYGVLHVKRKSRFPRARDARNGDELVPGTGDADIFEVVLAGTFDDDIFHVRVLRQSAPVVKGGIKVKV